MKALEAIPIFKQHLIKFLVSEGSNVNVKTIKSPGLLMPVGTTPLYTAAVIPKDKDGVEVVKFLVLKGEDVNAKDEEGNTPLDWAKKEGNTAVVQYLSGL